METLLFRLDNFCYAWVTVLWSFAKLFHSNSTVKAQYKYHTVILLNCDVRPHFLEVNRAVFFDVILWLRSEQLVWFANKCSYKTQYNMAPRVTQNSFWEQKDTFHFQKKWHPSPRPSYTSRWLLYFSERRMDSLFISVWVIQRVSWNSV